MNIQLRTKKVPPSPRFFCFDHIFIIPWVWVENLISFENWDFELFHGVKISLIFWRYFEDILKIFWRYFELSILVQKSYFFWQIQKYHFSHSDQKNFSFMKTSTSIDYFGKKFWKKFSSFINVIWVEHRSLYQTNNFFTFLIF